MIRTVADFLQALRARELAAIDRVRPVGHGGMIGDMYEGLTRHLLDRAVFKELDVRVVEGKILGSDGALSDQLDCLVVVGDGEHLPHTGHYIYPVAQVIAVVEVKKNLYGGELGDAYANLLSVAQRGEARDLPRRRVVLPFRAVAGVDLVDDAHVEHLSVTQQFTLYSIVCDVLLPVRVALGYFGYATEHTLREGFWRYLEAERASAPQRRLRGYGPSSLPNLVIAGDNALVKLNGMPYALSHVGDDWLLYGSVAGHATRLLLELVWSRLASQFGLSVDIFGNDLEFEQVNPLIAATVLDSPSGGRGWQYGMIHIPARVLAARPSTVPWQPAVLDEVQYVALTILTTDEVIDVDRDSGLGAYLQEQGIGLDEYVARVLATGLAYLGPDRKLRLLTDACVCAIDPDLGFIAAENSDGRFERWLLARLQRRGSSRQPIAGEP